MARTTKRSVYALQHNATELFLALGDEPRLTRFSDATHFPATPAGRREAIVRACVLRQPESGYDVVRCDA